VLRVAEIERSRVFYHEKLGLELLENYPNFFVVRAGALRISVFAGFEALTTNAEESVGFSIILSTEDVTKTKEEFEKRGINVVEDIVEAPGFMRYFTVKDPDGNLINIAQYLTVDILKNLE
jgi:predicted enzyme related to lactoylglutathione lyase